MREIYFERINEFNILLNNIKELESDLQSDVQYLSILKSASMLLMYNIVEGTVYSVLDETFDKLNSSDDFRILDSNIKQIFIEYYANKAQTSSNKAVQIMEDLVENRTAHRTVKFRQYNTDMKLFSGNLDRRKILDISKKFGVVRIRTKKGESLLSVKTIRNKLGHGEVSFSENGRNLSAREIEEKFTDLKTFIEAFISAFEEKYS